MARNKKLKKTLLHLLNEMIESNTIEKSFIDKTIKFILNHPMPFNKDNNTSHVTGSAWILNTTMTHTLLTHHKKLKKWLQLGGHIEAQDKSVLDAATREAKEESGLTKLRLFKKNIFDVDIHIIPAHKDIPEHSHYDIRFCYIADMNENLITSEESLAVSWIPLDHIALMTNSVSLNRMLKKTIQLKTSTL